MATNYTTSFTVNQGDLEYILKQIKIAEDSSIGYTPLTAPKTILQSIMDAYGVTAVNAAQLPAGLRTVDGTFNNLLPNNSEFGAADTLFPRLTDPVYVNDADGDQMPLGPPGSGAPTITNNNYGDTNGATAGGTGVSVADADPRIISNLIVDMTAANPAAVAAALAYSIYSGAITEADLPAASAAIAAAYQLTKTTDQAKVAAQNAEIAAQALFDLNAPGLADAAAATAAALVIANGELADAQTAYDDAVSASNAADAAAAAAQTDENNAAALVATETSEQAAAVAALAAADAQLLAAQNASTAAVIASNAADQDASDAQDAAAAAAALVAAEELDQAAAQADLDAADLAVATAQTAYDDALAFTAAAVADAAAAQADEDQAIADLAASELALDDAEAAHVAAVATKDAYTAAVALAQDAEAFADVAATQADNMMTLLGAFGATINTGDLIGVTDAMNAAEAASIAAAATYAALLADPNVDANDLSDAQALANAAAALHAQLTSVLINVAGEFGQNLQLELGEYNAAVAALAAANSNFANASALTAQLVASEADAALAVTAAADAVTDAIAARNQDITDLADATNASIAADAAVTAAQLLEVAPLAELNDKLALQVLAADALALADEELLAAQDAHAAAVIASAAADLAATNAQIAEDAAADLVTTETTEQAAAVVALGVADDELAAAQAALVLATAASNTADGVAAAAQAVEVAAAGVLATEIAEQGVAAAANAAALAAVANASAALNAAIAASNAADAAEDAADIALTNTLNGFGIEQTHLGDLTIPNLSPDIGLSPGFNSWMTYFGQFFDHGLDLVTKGNAGTVYIPLAADDPLIAGADGVFGTGDDLPTHLRFMALTRATQTVDANGIPQHENTTTSWIDQNQTYTSHASHQVFLREYVMTANGAVSTGRLLDGQAANGSLNGAIGNWAEVKAQALEMLGIKLNDFDVHNAPLLLTDQYGKFIPGANGYAQMVMAPDGSHATNWLQEGTASGITTAGSIGTGHAFLNDIAHHAAPSIVDHDHNPATAKIAQVADGDNDANGNGVYDAGDTLTDVNGDGSITTADFYADDSNELTYDNEMLNSHFITGDGRGNENIALTTVHSIFHSEHNRLVDANQITILKSGNLAFINEWLVVDLLAAPVIAPNATDAEVRTLAAGLTWDGERLFQAARFATEMQYQHLVFEEFARRIQPMVDPFIFNSVPEIDPSIVAEFAHTVYRFGHSMLTDTVDRLENDLTTVNGDADQQTLLALFLNPQGYLASGVDLATANANIIRGLSRDLGNEMDEFIVSDVRSNLLGLPLDLAALNIARGRDTGIPSLNETRAQLYNDSGLADLKPYTSWADFAQNIKNPVSVINFIAAYGTHQSLTQLVADGLGGFRKQTAAEMRDAATLLVLGDGDDSNGVTIRGTTYLDRFDFLNATGTYAGGNLGGLNLVDLWIGGLAEQKMEFGGMLGSTFNYVFEAQMEALQFGDRMYYLTRTQGTNLLNQLEPNTFSDLVMRNTELGDIYSTHLNGALFTTPDHIIELDRHIAQTDYNGAESGIDPTWSNLILGPKVVRDYTNSVLSDGHDFGGYLKVLGGEHYVLGGTEGNDTLLSDKGIDTIWGDAGNDYINAGMESDDVFGGAGDDIIEDPFGDDVLRGNAGNDVISDARGANLLFGDDGIDYIIQGQDASEAFGGTGDDFILGGAGKDFQLGNEGNDWMEGGAGFDTLSGDNSELFFNSPIIGHDVLFNQGDEGDYDAESGDDIMGSGPSVFRYEGMFGFDWAIGKGDFLSGVNFDMAIPIFTTIPNDVLKDRFDQVEALSGWQLNDYLQGDDRGHKGGGSSAPDSVPVELFADHLLTQEGITRITGLNQWFGGVGDSGMDSTDARLTLFGGSPDTGVPGSTPLSTFRDGNILMGGDGNDTIRGRGGYDLIDGDAYLNVRISIVIPTGPNAGAYSAESMNTDVTAMGQYAGFVYHVDANGHPIFTDAQGNHSPAFGGASLNSLMLNGTINPGNMHIVREILNDTTNVNGPGMNIDTAVFQGAREEYDIEGITLQVNGNGNNPDTISYVGTARDLNGDGFISIQDRDTGAVGATVTRIVDGVATQVTLTSRSALTDDRDLIKNIEQLQFADQILTIAGNNHLATGTVTIGDPTPFDGQVTPYVGQVLVPTLTNFADQDGIPLDSNGLPVGLTYEWQTTEFGHDSGWSTIQTSNTYTVRSVDPGHVLRAVAVFQDAAGNTERITSALTDNPTAAFSVNENSAAGTVVANRIPFSIDYDSQSINGQPPADIDLTTLFHAIDPANSSGGRFTVVAVPGQVDFQGTQLFQIVVNQGGPVFLNYEATVHTPANQSHQFVDNQYQVVVNSYSDNPANGGVLVAVRQFTIFLNDMGEIADIAPTLDLNADATTTTTANFSENFGTNSYTDSDGAWTQDWVETGDDGSSTSDSGGQIRINNNELQFDNADAAANSNGALITRVVDLSGATSATLSFNYNEQGFDTGDNETVLVQFAADGVNFTTIQTIDGNSGNGTSTNLALTGALGANSAVRFVVSSVNGAFDLVSIDNIVIAKNTTTTVLGTSGNNYTTTFTEPGTLADGTPVAIAVNPSVVDADSALIMGATIKLTNAKDLDALTIQGALPAGITSSFGPAVAGVITMYLSGPASKADFQAAIAQVRYSNTSQDPDATPRTIEVTVNDGEKESLAATATVTIIEMNDPPITVNDTIITNFANGASFSIPEWALLANDTDPDSPTLDVTAVGGASNLTGLTLNPGFVTMAHTTAGNSSFDYTGSDGSLTDVATASVTRSVASTTLSETFGGTSYTDSDGAWTQDWVETDDDVSSTAANGQIRITGNHLEFDAGNIAAASNGASIQRTVNLTGATSATLSFDYDENGFDATETVLVQFAADGVNFTTVQTINNASGNGSSSIALSGAFGANSAIRFVVSTMNIGDGDNVQIDNIAVTYSAPSNDIIAGAGNQILVGNLAGTVFSGGTGNDIILAGGGNDTINYVMGDGADTVDGQGDTDTLNITVTGAAAANVLDVVYAGTSLTAFEGGTITNVENVTANLNGGIDTLSYVGSTSAVTVNLGTGAASGFTSISNIENVTGGSGNDSITGSNAANLIDGGAGNDTLRGGVGNDTVNGGTGNDLINYLVGDNATDVVDGGADFDTLAITAGANATQALDVIFDGISLTNFEGAGTITNVESVTADLGGGTDTLSYGAGTASAVSVNLAAGTASGFTSIAGFDNVTGGSGNDILVGNTGANVITGGLGRDVMTSGGSTASVDTFDFNDSAESAVGLALADVIVGYNAGDIIDLNTIDANTGTFGNGNFTNQFGGAFTGAGQVRYVAVDTDGIGGNDSTLIQGNTGGTTAPEFEILLQNYIGIVTING